MIASSISLTLLLFVQAELVDVRELDEWMMPNLTDRVAWLDGAPYTREAVRFHHVHCLLPWYTQAMNQAAAGMRERLYQADAYRDLHSHLARTVSVLTALEAAQDPCVYIAYRRDRLRDARDALPVDDWQKGIPP